MVVPPVAPSPPELATRFRSWPRRPRTSAAERTPPPIFRSLLPAAPKGKIFPGSPCSVARTDFRQRFFLNFVLVSPVFSGDGPGSIRADGGGVGGAGGVASRGAGRVGGHGHGASVPLGPQELRVSNSLHLSFPSVPCDPVLRWVILRLGVPHVMLHLERK